MASILTAKKVTKRFGGLVAVNAVDFEIPEKAIVSIISPNGAGKTTFFNCITGFGKCDEGDILFEGTPIQRLRPDQITKLGVSRTYQNIRLFADMFALENILVGQHVFLHAPWFESVLGLPNVIKEERNALAEAQRLLNFVEIKGKGDMLARNLPYGAQRRLDIARALATKPKLLLHDEPSTGMNPRETEDLTAFIRRLRDELGITILLIEHHMRVVMGISENITVLGLMGALATIPAQFGGPKFLPSKVSTYLNLGPIRQGGFEASIEHRLNNEWLVNGNSSWQHNPEILDADAGQLPYPASEVGIPAENRFNVGLNYNGRRFLGNLNVNYSDSALWTDVLTGEYQGYTDAYTMLNATIGVKFADGKATFSLRGTNLTNEKTCSTSTATSSGGRWWRSCASSRDRPAVGSKALGVVWTPGAFCIWVRSGIEVSGSKN